MSRRHRVFVSYHHANDQNYKNIFELRFGNRFGVVVPGSVDTGDIDPGLQVDTIRQKIRDDYLRDTTVTVVLVGTETWQRKHVDWEIASSIRDGLLLPSHPNYRRDTYSPYIIPPRLYKNIECEYAKLYHWSNDPDEIEAWVHEAYLRRKRVLPDNSYPHFVNNRSGDRWYD